MISADQVKSLSKKFKINESIVVREYIQLLFLKKLYEQSFSKDIYFKGGTAIRLLFNGDRFSEDLDFTVQAKESDFKINIKKFLSSLENQYPISFKERKTITGKTYLLTAKVPHQKSNIFVKLDFSMRENILEPSKNIIKTDYPIVMQAFVNSLSKNEILAEKIRAILTRKKHRDLYDLWMLQELGAKIDTKLISKKLAYYHETFKSKNLIKKLDSFSSQEFIQDLRPFVSIDRRDKLPDLFKYIKIYLKDSFEKL